MVSQNIPKSYDEAIQTLASWHADGQSEEIQIFAFPDPAQQEVRLLEVTPGTAPSGEVMAFHFGRSRDFPFPSVVAQVTPAEWEQIEKSEIPLPEGWSLKQKRRIWPL